MAVTAKTPVYCDLSRGYFVAGRYSTQVTSQPFEQFFSRDNLKLEVYPLILNPAASRVGDPYSVADLSGMSLTITIFNSTGSTVLATSSSFTADTDLGILTGNIDCNTSDMVTAVTSDPTSVIIEARFSGTFGSKNVRADGVSIRKQLNFTGAPSVLPATSYYSRDEINGLLRNLTVESIRFDSPDGTKKKVQYLGNDDSMHLDQVT